DEAFCFCTTVPTGNKTYTAKFARILTLTFESELEDTLIGTSTTVTFNENTQAVTDAEVTVPNGYRFLGWHNGTDIVCTAEKFACNTTSLTANTTFTAKFERIIHSLAFKTPGNGTITLSDGAPGAAAHGEAYTFTATAIPDDGYEFSHWTRNNSRIEGGSTLFFENATWAQNAEYTAVFTVKKCTVTFITETEGGSLSYDKSEYTRDYGGTLPIVMGMYANASDGYSFAGWYHGNTVICKSTTFSYEKPIHDDMTIEARFVKVLTLTFKSDAGVMDTVRFSQGSQASMNITPPDKDGYAFIGWYDGEALACDTETFSYDTTILTSDKTFMAKFTKILTLTFTVESVGTVSGTTSVHYPQHTQAELDVAASGPDGYDFLGWFDGNICVCKKADFDYDTTTWTADKTITARFAKVLNLTFASEIEGTLTGNETVSFYEASQAQMDAAVTVPVGYEFLGWFDGETRVCQTAQFKCDTTRLATDKTFTAKFKSATYTIRFAGSTGGSVASNNKPESIVFGGKYSFTVTAIADNGYTFAYWTCNDERIDAGATLTFTDKSWMSSESYVAHFDPEALSVTFRSSTGGTVALTGAPEEFCFGEEYTFTVTASGRGDYSFSHWTCNGTTIPGKSVLSFNAQTWTEDTEYIAVFKPNRLRILFMAEDGGSLFGDLEYTVGYNSSTAAFLVSAAANPGYRFEGWYLGDKKVCNTARCEIDSMVCLENITFTAHFSKELTLTFRSELVNTFGGTNTVKFSSGSQAVLDATVQIPEGYEFLGWHDGNEIVCTAADFFIDTAKLTENMTYTAKFEPGTYSLRFTSSEGGTVMLPEGTPERVTYGVNYNITATAVENENYTFLRWECNGKPINSGSVLQLDKQDWTKDMEYTAVFVLTPLTFTFTPEQGGRIAGNVPNIAYGEPSSFTVTA
ncbi:MAG: InlB B-repeat-containing protein, partial [Clostridia bacterium]|nr:InlB B-repeat-containing protein [Clostridia bacterium]